MLMVCAGLTEVLNRGFFFVFSPIHLTCACLSHQATAEANNLAAVAAAKNLYNKNMERVGSLTCERRCINYTSALCLLIIMGYGNTMRVVFSYNPDYKRSLFPLLGVRGRLALRESRLSGGKEYIFLPRGSSQLLLDQEDGRTRVL